MAAVKVSTIFSHLLSRQNIIGRLPFAEFKTWSSQCMKKTPVPRLNSKFVEHELSPLINSTELKHLSADIVKERYRILNDAGIGREEIFKKNKLLLLTPAKIRNVIEVVKKLKIDRNALPELLLFKTNELNKCLTRLNSDLCSNPEHRLEYLTKALRVSHLDIARLFHKYNFFLSLSYEHLRSSLNVLLQFGVQPEDIIRDPWVLRCKPDAISLRLKRLVSADVTNIKPWMVRCTEDVFDGFLQRVSSKQKLLGESSLEEYLSERLGLSTEEMTKIMDRAPPLQKTGVLKMKRILDFLFASGFSASHIISGLPRVANRRIETIHSRILELNQAGITPNLYVLCKSKREYDSYVRKWKNKNK